MQQTLKTVVLQTSAAVQEFYRALSAGRAYETSAWSRLQRQHPTMPTPQTAKDKVWIGLSTVALHSVRV